MPHTILAGSAGAGSDRLLADRVYRRRGTDSKPLCCVRVVRDALAPDLSVLS
jgi:hypothetical protein